VSIILDIDDLARIALRAGATGGDMATKKRAQARAQATSQSGSARTLVYIHGIGNKPPEDVLRCQWDRALFEHRLGERSRMAYWRQEDRHGPPLETTCAGSDSLWNEAKSAPGFGARALAHDATAKDLVAATGRTAAERAWLQKLFDEMEVDRPRRAGKKGVRGGVSAAGVEDWDYPDFLVRWLTGAFAKDVRDFFFDEPRRRRMQESLRQRLETGAPFVVVAHSQGTMIAYSVLHALDPTRHRIPLFVTLGSPLGLGEVTSQLRDILKLPRGKLPFPRCVDAWVNVFDEKDLVAHRERLADHYQGAILDLKVKNLQPNEPHSATGYLGISELRAHVRTALDLQRFQPLAPFRLASDATQDFERAAARDRRPLLIELSDPTWVKTRRAELGTEGRKTTWPRGGADTVPDSLETMAEEVMKTVGEIVGAKELSNRRVQRLRRYVSIDLTRAETERLSETHPDLAPFYRIWRNGKKVPTIDRSIHTIQVSAAHRSYEADGNDIEWAVLDSGCSPHPHFEFQGRRTIAARWDCTLVSNLPLKDGKVAGGHHADSRDHYGHGTHVAGIIAGRYDVAGDRGRDPRTLSGMAPRARLHIYKVLDDAGQGDDAWIIKALDHIASVNEEAGGPRIAGVNLSLGGPFEPDVFGCGHTPLCDELRRLWRQGVLIVVSAGNEGFAKLLSTDGEVYANMPMSIGDPANLEESIAVGAVHRERPHSYGVSHFSSRGPTADGRMKPDCVAPGEQILSCRHDVDLRNRRRPPTVRDLYMKLDGTSMAAPHVSGVLAAFLSRRREFLGNPDRVKEILLANCTSLGRERAMQGAGMPNLVRMLVST
jgi:hypothetical protein